MYGLQTSVEEIACRIKEQAHSTVIAKFVAQHSSQLPRMFDELRRSEFDVDDIAVALGAAAMTCGYKVRLVLVSGERQHHVFVETAWDLQLQWVRYDPCNGTYSSDKMTITKVEPQPMVEEKMYNVLVYRDSHKEWAKVVDDSNPQKTFVGTLNKANALADRMRVKFSGVEHKVVPTDSPTPGHIESVHATQPIVSIPTTASFDVMKLAKAYFVTRLSREIERLSEGRADQYSRIINIMWGENGKTPTKPEVKERAIRRIQLMFAIMNDNKVIK